MALVGWALGGVWAAASPLVAASPIEAAFKVVAFHDVVDHPGEADPDAVTTDRLVAFFDHLRGEGWNPISLQDLSDARAGRKPLPPKAILITFDDGYSSLYTRVYPLLLAYRIPVVAALVGDWLERSADERFEVGGRGVRRARFLTWDQARELQASGLVEFASHSHAQHREVLGNPQGNLTPALSTAAFDRVAQRYESPSNYRDRLRADLRANEALMLRELGTRPRAMVWPYGRYNQAALDLLAEAGYEFAFTLDYEPGQLQRPLEIGRYWPTGNLQLSDLINDLGFGEVLPPARRMVRLDPARLWSADPAVFDQRLGLAIERLRALGITDVVINGLHRHGDGSWRAWFPNRVLPVHADALNRIAWQMRTRAGVRPWVDLAMDQLIVQLPAPDVVRLHHDLGWQVPLDGLFMRSSGGSGRWSEVQGPQRRSSQAGALRHARRQLNPAGFQLEGLSASQALALTSFQAVEASRPGLQWLVLTQGQTPEALAQWADMVLVETEAPQGFSWPGPGPLAHAQVDDAMTRRRTGLWLRTPQPLSPSQWAAWWQALLRQGVAVAGGELDDEVRP